MKILGIRFNTENKGSDFWRIITEEGEQFAESVAIQVPTFTTQDTLPDGRTKWHLSCFYNELVWSGTKLIVQ